MTTATFDETVGAATGLVLVDFWAPWCGPCRAIAPVLDKLVEGQEDRLSLVKVNVDESPELAARYEVRAIPTILLFKDGKIVDRVVGAVPRSVLEDKIHGQA